MAETPVSSCFKENIRKYSDIEFPFSFLSFFARSVIQFRREKVSRGESVYPDVVHFFFFLVIADVYAN